MSVRTVHRLLLVVVLALVAYVASRPRTPVQNAPARTAELRPLALVPPGPAFVMTVDMARLRASPLAPALARFGLAELVATTPECRFDPLRDLSEVVVASAGLPAGATLPALGSSGTPSAPAAVIASGRFGGRMLAGCASARIASRGGNVSVTNLGSFLSVRDRELAAEVAAKDGLVVLSEGRYLREILDLAEGRANEGTELDRLRDRLHTELRRTFGRGAPVLATVVVPDGWLARSFGQEAAASPLASIRSAALRVELGARVTVGGFLGCVTEKGCGDVAAFLGETSKSVMPLLGEDGARLLGSVVVRHERERVELSLELTMTDLAALAAILGLE